MFISINDIKNAIIRAGIIASSLMTLSKFNFKYNPLNIFNKKTNDLKK